MLKRSSSRTVLFLSLIGLASGIVLCAIFLHEALSRREREDAAFTNARLLSETTAQCLSSINRQSEESLDVLCGRLLDNPLFLAVVIWNEKGCVGRCEAKSGIASLLEIPGASLSAPLVMPASVAAFCDQIETPAYATYCTIPGRGSDQPWTLGLLIVSPDTAESGWIMTWIFPVGLSFGSGLALLGAYFWLRRRILTPIEMVVEAAAAKLPENVGESNPEGQALGEFEVIAQAIDCLSTDLRATRQKAHLIERRVDSKVAEETRRIAADLRAMEKEATTDPLTGLFNRRVLQTRYPQMFAAQRESRNDLSVIMFDLDHFKKVNDVLGHVTGDNLLRFIGELLRQCSRSEDLAARFGGDEFALVLSGASANDAHVIATRIITLFAQRAKMIASTEPSPGLTAGVASMGAHEPKDAAQLLHMADQALYIGKQSGRKQVCVSKQKGVTRPSTSQNRVSTVAVPSL